MQNYIDVVPSSAKQDAAQVQTILRIAVVEVHRIIPSARNFILVSDNGAAFSSKDNIDFCFNQNKSRWGCDLFLQRWLYFEAQTGKTALDTHFAYVGISIEKFARKNIAVKNHVDVVNALIDGGGIAATTTIRADFAHDEEDTTVDNDSSLAAGSKADVKL
jgi:hypothetical protein